MPADFDEMRKETKLENASIKKERNAYAMCIYTQNFSHSSKWDLRDRSWEQDGHLWLEMQQHP